MDVADSMIDSGTPPDKADEYFATEESRIHTQYDVPEQVLRNEGDPPNPAMLSRLGMPEYRKWIRAAAYGRMSIHQLEYWLGHSCEFDYVDPHWIMLGEFLWYSQDFRTETEWSELQETMERLCTRNAAKAKRLPFLGYTFWGEPDSLSPCPVKYWIEVHELRINDDLSEDETAHPDWRADYIRRILRDGGPIYESAMDRFTTKQKDLANKYNRKERKRLEKILEKEAIQPVTKKT